MNVSIAIPHDRSYPEVSYTLRTLLEVVGLPFTFVSPAAGAELGETVWLHYGLPGERDRRGVWIPAGPAALWQAAEPGCVDLDGVPVLYAGEPPPALLRPHENGVDLGFDLVWASFWLLSRQEELNENARDRFGRFESAKSWLTRHNLVKVPVLDLYAELLARALSTVARNRGVPLLRKLRWPQGRPYAVVLSHDVDDAGRFSPRQGMRLLSRAAAQRAPRGIARGVYFATAGLARSLARRPDPYWNFEKVMHLEAAAGFRSTFFFVPEARDVNRDPPYEVDTPRMRDLFARLHQGGWELGVHGSFDSFQDAAILNAEREKLERLSGAPVAGVRQHYLRLAWPGTFRAQAAAGFAYDSTVGYQDCIGFRAGAAFPFHPFDPETGESVPLLELPLTIMDGSLFWGLKLAEHEATARTLALLETVRAVGGLAVLLWHQRVWHNRRYPGWHQVYEQTVKYLRTEGQAWVSTAGQAANWWLAREAVQLEEIHQDGDRWRWRYRAGQHLDGLTLSLEGTVGGRVAVEGAGATTRTTGEGQIHIELGSLATRQPFEVVLTKNEWGSCSSQLPTEGTGAKPGDQA